MKLDQKSKSKSHHVLLFGAPFSGKTALAGELSKEFDILYIDMDNGVDTLLKLPLEQQKRIEVISLPDTRSFPIAIETCLKLVRGGPVSVCDKHGKVSCAICKKDGFSFTDLCLNELPLTTVVIWDSLSQLTNSAIAHITKGQPDDYKMEFDDWANLVKLMDTFFSHIQQAPFNTVCITHETEVELEDGKTKLVPTAGSRNYSRTVSRFFDEAVYLEVKNKKHVVASGTTYANNILTGSRSGIILEGAAHASLAAIFKGEVVPTVAQTAAAKTPATSSLDALAKLKNSMVRK